MKQLILILSVLVLSACGLQKGSLNNPNGGSWDSEFSPFLNRFLELARQHNKSYGTSNLSIFFDESLSNTNTLGVCRRGGNSQEILINPRAWATWKRYNVLSSQEQLMFHELAHCLMGRGHTTIPVPLVNSLGEPYYENGIPEVHSGSIMNPSHIGEIYAYNWTSYIKELFTGVVPAFVYASGTRDFPLQAYNSPASSPIVKTSTLASVSNEDMQVFKTNGSVNDDGIVELSNCDHH